MRGDQRRKGVGESDTFLTRRALELMTIRQNGGRFPVGRPPPPKVTRYPPLPTVALCLGKGLPVPRSRVSVRSPEQQLEISDALTVVLLFTQVDCAWNAPYMEISRRSMCTGNHTQPSQ